MSGGGGGPVIIRKNIAPVPKLESVLEQLGPLKRGRLAAINAKNSDTWTKDEFLFVLRCIREAYEAYEE